MTNVSRRRRNGVLEWDFESADEAAIGPRALQRAVAAVRAKGTEDA